MKKTLALLLTLTMLLSLSACGGKEEEGGVPNPMTEYASLAELNEATLSRLVGPGVMGVSDESFIAYDCGDYLLAEYNFTVAGVKYMLRSAPTLEDISGFYVNGEPAFSGDIADGINYAEGEDGVQLARWANVDGQYVFACLSENDGFTGIAEEMYAVNSPSATGGVDFATLPGEYQDSVSQRASMTVEDNGDETVHMLVSWANSAFETMQWEMNSSLGEDGLLYYTDGSSSLVSTAEDGTQEVKVLSVNTEGFFSIADGVLYWNGAADESCRECAFEKVA